MKSGNFPGSSAVSFKLDVAYVPCFQWHIRSSVRCRCNQQGFTIPRRFKIENQATTSWRELTEIHEPNGLAPAEIWVDHTLEYEVQSQKD